MTAINGDKNSRAANGFHAKAIEPDDEFGIRKALLNSGIELYGCRAQIAPMIKEDPITRVKQVRAMEVRDDDIFILAYPKTGTHWTWEITNMLVRQSTSYENRTKEHVMIEFSQIPNLNAESSPRILNSHLWLNHLPPELVTKKCKIIHLVRNPKDILVSFFHHTRQHGGPNFTFDLLLKLFTEDRMNAPNYMEFLRHISAFQKSHPGYPIKHVYYEDMKKNPVKTIQDLAEFLQIPATEKFCEEIASACSFDKMKQMDDDRKIPADFQETFKKLNVQDGRLKFYRKGIIGDWKNKFTVAQNEIFDDFLQKEMAKGLDFQFIYE